MSEMTRADGNPATGSGSSRLIAVVVYVVSSSLRAKGRREIEMDGSRLSSGAGKSFLLPSALWSISSQILLIQGSS